MRLEKKFHLNNQEEALLLFANSSIKAQLNTQFFSHLLHIK